MSRRIFANHCHIYPEERRPNGTVDALKAYMEECEIEKAVAFAPFPHVMKDAGLTCDRNEFLAKQIVNDDRFVGFGTVDFDHEDIADQVKHIASLGFKGIKVHPAAQEIGVTGEKAFALYEEAVKQSLFLSFHTGLHWHRLMDYHPILFDEVAWNFPELQFSMEHIGGYHFFRDALAVICNNERHEPHGNVYAGWTSISDSNPPGKWSLSDEELLTVIRQTGAEYSIFGTDFPFQKPETLKAAIARFESLDIGEEAKDALFGKNLARVLGVEL
ncbi:MAG TPA: hypothetical protein DDY98_03115 [Ruminococcaceae bacterium]|nr:hypothetical protein [Oscillospiraceae bacterium]